MRFVVPRVLTLFVLAIAAIFPAGSFEQKEAVTTQLIHELKNKNPQVRASAAETLGDRAAGRPVTADDRRAIPVLVNALTDSNSTVREKAAFALGNIALGDKTVVPGLVRALNDTDSSVREAAARSLGRIHEGINLAVPALIRALADDDSSIRQTAMTALISFGPDTAVALPDLMKLLKSNSASDRWRAAQVIAAIGPVARNAAPVLMATLKDESDNAVRLEVAAALAAIGVNKSEALPVVLELVRNEDEFARVRAAGVLGKFGASAQSAVPALSKALKDESPDVRRIAAIALSRIARDAERSRTLDAADALKAAQVAMEQSSDPRVTTYAEAVAHAADTLQALRHRSLKQRLVNPVTKHPLLAMLFATYAGIAAVWAVLFWFAPVSVLTINESFRRLPQVKLPGWLGGIEIPVGYLILAEFLHYRDRVLSAWVKHNLPQVRAAFEPIASIKIRAAGSGPPVVIDGHELPTLTVDDLRPEFRKPKICVLICGDNMPANRLLACRIGRWAMESEPAKRLRNNLMLPVLLDEDFIYRSNSDTEPLTKTVRDKLQLHGPPLSIELVRQLLEREYVLVIIDRFSELGPDTQSMIRPESAEFPAHALVITSRTDERFGGIPKITIRVADSIASKA